MADQVIPNCSVIYVQVLPVNMDGEGVEAWPIVRTERDGGTHGDKVFEELLGLFLHGLSVGHEQAWRNCPKAVLRSRERRFTIEGIRHDAAIADVFVVVVLVGSTTPYRT